jgi:hypothetical protein
MARLSGAEVELTRDQSCIAHALVALVWASWHLPYLLELTWMYTREDPATFLPRLYLGTLRSRFCTARSGLSPVPSGQPCSCMARTMLRTSTRRGVSGNNSRHGLSRLCRHGRTRHDGDHRKHGSRSEALWRCTAGASVLRRQTVEPAGRLQPPLKTWFLRRGSTYVANPSVFRRSHRRST